MRKRWHLIVPCVCLLVLTGCGPTLCDCVADIPGNTFKSIEKWVEGDKLDFKNTQKLTKECQEKFGAMTGKELLEAYQSCNK